MFPSAAPLRTSRPKTARGGCPLNLVFVSSRHIRYLAEFHELVVRRNCPKDEPLSGRRFLQVVETHLDFGCTTLVRRDEHVCTSTRQRSRKVNLDLGIVASLVGRDVE